MITNTDPNLYHICNFAYSAAGLTPPEEFQMRSPPPFQDDCPNSTEKEPESEMPLPTPAENDKPQEPLVSSPTLATSKQSFSRQNSPIPKIERNQSKDEKMKNSLNNSRVQSRDKMGSSILKGRQQTFEADRNIVDDSKGSIDKKEKEEDKEIVRYESKEHESLDFQDRGILSRKGTSRSQSSQRFKDNQKLMLNKEDGERDSKADNQNDKVIEADKKLEEENGPDGNEEIADKPEQKITIKLEPLNKTSPKKLNANTLQTGQKVQRVNEKTEKNAGISTKLNNERKILPKKTPARSEEKKLELIKKNPENKESCNPKTLLTHMDFAVQQGQKRGWVRWGSIQKNRPKQDASSKRRVNNPTLGNQPKLWDVEKNMKEYREKFCHPYREYYLFVHASPSKTHLPSISSRKAKSFIQTPNDFSYVSQTAITEGGPNLDESKVDSLRLVGTVKEKYTPQLDSSKRDNHLIPINKNNELNEHKMGSEHLVPIPKRNIFAKDLSADKVLSQERGGDTASNITLTDNSYCLSYLGGTYSKDNETKENKVFDLTNQDRKETKEKVQEIHDKQKQGRNKTDIKLMKIKQIYGLDDLKAKFLVRDIRTSPTERNQTSHKDNDAPNLSNIHYKTEIYRPGEDREKSLNDQSNTNGIQNSAPRKLRKEVVSHKNKVDNSSFMRKFYRVRKASEETTNPGLEGRNPRFEQTREQVERLLKERRRSGDYLSTLDRKYGNFMKAQRNYLNCDFDKSPGPKYNLSSFKGMTRPGTSFAIEEYMNNKSRSDIEKKMTNQSFFNCKKETGAE